LNPASNGISFGIAKSLAVPGVSHLAILGRRPGTLANAKAAFEALVGGKIKFLTISADLSKKAIVDNPFKQIASEFGGAPDILVTNAGGFTGGWKIGEESEEEWQIILNINIKGVYYVAAAFIAVAKLGSILIDVSSSIGQFSFSLPGYASYATTKLASTKIMQYVSAENPHVHVVDLQPGEVRETDLGDKAAAGGDIPNVHRDDGELPLPLWSSSAVIGLTDVCLQLSSQVTRVSGWQAQKQGS
jgi:NAD(P)-dependent dehydrogenase (short-subunit alcohol dehydrogenase family)